MAGGHYEKDVFKQLQETMSRLDALERKYETDMRQLKQDHRKEILRLEAEYKAREQQLKQIIALQGQTIQRQQEEIAALKKKNEQLLAEIDRLKSIINNNSSNSSQPPSADQKGGKPANTHNGREKSTRSKGAQAGHTGVTLTKAEVERHIKAGEYKHELNEHGDRRGTPVIKYEIDMRVELCAIEHRFYPDENGQYHIPRGFGGEVMYGQQIKALVVYLYSVGVVSIQRIEEIVNGLCGGRVKISKGCIYEYINGFSEGLSEEMKAIAKRLLNQSVLYTDNTNISVDGRQQYVRNTSSADCVLYEVMEKKNLSCMEKLTVLKDSTATLVHDHETAAYHFGSEHAECNVHLLRYLKKNTEDTKHAWSERMSGFLSGLNRKRTERIRAGRPFSEDERKQFEAEYDRICQEGTDENQSCKLRWAQKDELKLLRRLRKYKQNHLLFLSRFDVAFDNNLSERDLRKCKTRQKMSGGFRAKKGAEMYCRILSFIETCKRQAIDVFGAIVRVVCGVRVLGVGEQ